MCSGSGRHRYGQVSLAFLLSTVCSFGRLPGTLSFQSCVPKLCA